MMLEALTTLRGAAPAAPIDVVASDPFDADWARALERAVLRPINEVWFRVQVFGAEHIPKTGPLILASNHSGNAFPYDAIALDSVLWQRDDMREEAKLRTVFEPSLSSVWWMRPYGIDNFWRRGGGVDMTFDNFDRLLARGDRVLYFPEGVPGIGKGFNNRYRLRPFRTSFLLLAARHHAPVIPIYAINAEWLHPFGYVFRPLDRVMQRVFRVPFLPLPLGLAAIVFPWIWYLTFPARLVFVVGEPIDVEAILRDEGIASLDGVDRAALRRAANRVRLTMQDALTRYVEEYGNRPYDAKSLLAALWHEGRRLYRSLPLCWPATFLRHERDRQRPPARHALHALMRDLDLAAFYLPFGWPLLSLSRALRKPPAGYRGVPSRECQARRGEYLWKLADRPLPTR
ncbi:MAG TPA: 1-acyl-sn-glycerol-3-phosphate acyltransferase, partial [Gemmatimonadaceae bacterium]|nr:1-acyl-sn-glycerol-3-phosphate acyltransferase [Gemmatimonadaceae bacterium]